MSEIVFKYHHNRPNCSDANVELRAQCDGVVYVCQVCSAVTREEEVFDSTAAKKI